MKRSYVVIIVIVAVVLVLFFWIKGMYNSMVRTDETVSQAWAQVENVYQRRADLVPNLVATVVIDSRGGGGGQGQGHSGYRRPLHSFRG